MLLFWKVLKKSFVDAYENLAFTIVSSSLFVGALLACIGILRLTAFGQLPPIFISGLLVAYILVLAPIISGTCAYARSILTHEDQSIGELFFFIRKTAISAWKLALLQVVITLLVLINLWFYFTHGGIICKIIAVLFIYILFFWLASMIYHFPVMIEQGCGAFLAVKRGFLLEIDNIGFTALMFFVIILLTIVSIATFIGLVFIYNGVMSMLATNMVRALFVKYNLLPAEEAPDLVVDDGFPPYRNNRN